MGELIIDYATGTYHYRTSSTVGNVIPVGLGEVNYQWIETDPSSIGLPPKNQYFMCVYKGVIWVVNDVGEIFTPPVQILSIKHYSVDGQTEFLVGSLFKQGSSLVSVNGVDLDDDQWSYVASDPVLGTDAKVVLNTPLKENDLFKAIY
jgi:hypothetical protein